MHAACTHCCWNASRHALIRASHRAVAGRAGLTPGFHICTETGLARATSAPGLGSPPGFHICIGTWLPRQAELNEILSAVEFLDRASLELVEKHLPGCKDPLDAPCAM
jgi:hypothetical protein